MTISTETRKAGPFTGNGVTTSFAFSFKVFDDDDVVVKLTVIATGAVSTLTRDTDYTLSLNSDQNSNPGGTVTYNPSSIPMPSTKTLTITSDVSMTQGTDITNAGGFYPNVIEDMADRATILAQQNSEHVERAIRAPAVDSASLSDLPTASQRASKYLAFDSSGQPVATSGAPTADVIVSAFMETVLDDSTAAAARATLGAAATGAVNDSGLTMTADRLLGRSSDEITGAVGHVELSALFKLHSQTLSLNDSRPGVLRNIGLVATFGILGAAATVEAVSAAGSTLATTEKAVINFRSSTLSSSISSALTLSSSVSCAITSGATLGTVSNQTYRLWIAAINNNGTVELAVMNALNGTDITPIDEDGLISTTAMSNAADSAGVWYSTTARSSVPFVVLGYLEGVQAAAGTWADAATKIVVNTKRRPGDVVQSVISQDGTLASGSTVIPFDNTVPQNTEGNQYMSKAITPTSAANVLEIEHGGQYGNSGSANHTVALFQDSTANALKAAGINLGTNSQRLTLSHTMVANTASSTTFKVRAGPSAGTCYFNGATGGTQLYSTGTCESHLKIVERFA